MSMTRRDFLKQLEFFCMAYGLQSILSPNAFGTTGGPTRLVNFVIKYTGGGTDENGVGRWNTSEVLSPLKPFESNLMIPLGLNAEFYAPMNSHAAPQVSALSGAMTGFVLRETYYPLGALEKFSTGDGKSIDVLIGEQLKAKFACPLPYLLMTNNDSNSAEASTHRTSSWGANGQTIHSLATIAGVRNELAARAECEKFARPSYAARLKALNTIRERNQNIFSSTFLIDRSKFEELSDTLTLNATQTEKTISNIDRRGQIACSSLAPVNEINNSQNKREDFVAKMERLYDLGILALQDNVTRVLTYNLYLSEAHETSHYSITPIDKYYDICRFYQNSIASFLSKLKAKNLYTDTMIFCNAGSCIKDEVHNYENLATYVINGGATGVRGSAADRKPVGSLLLDILNAFGLNYSEYGGRDHKLGVARRGNYL